jgi:hypothetical protein
VASYDDLLSNCSLANNTEDFWRQIHRLLQNRALLFRQLIEYWQLNDVEVIDEEPAFSITPLMRQLPVILSGQCSPREYLALDQSDPWKNEYYNGSAY